MMDKEKMALQQLSDNGQELIEHWKRTELASTWSQERRSFAHTYVEKPMMISMLPNLLEKKILMLGCGTGEESELLEHLSASYLVGIDISCECIEVARKKYPQSEFFVADMHMLPFEDCSFDFVYSSLAIHYSNKLDVVFGEVNRVLKEEGKFLFSVGHPIRFASEMVVINDEACRMTGYYYQEGNTCVVGEYMSHNLHSQFFPNNEILEFYTAPPSLYFKELVRAGFEVQDFSESTCSEQCKSINASYYEKYKELPQFMAFLACKGSNHISK